MENKYIDNDSLSHEYPLSKYIDYIHPEQFCNLYDSSGKDLFSGMAKDIPSEYLPCRCCIVCNDICLNVTCFMPTHMFLVNLEIVVHTGDTK